MPYEKIHHINFIYQKIDNTNRYYIFNKIVSNLQILRQYNQKWNNKMGNFTIIKRTLAFGMIYCYTQRNQIRHIIAKRDNEY